MPKLITRSPWQAHVSKWSGCTKCSLCKGRKNVVLLRGIIPCDVLFIGEAPGPSENKTGKPFIGPAGHLLDEIIEHALEEVNGEGIPTLELSFTNLVACIPLTAPGSGKKFEEPPKEAIMACEERLNECVRICQPRAIVLVGKLSKEQICGEAQFYEEPDGNKPGYGGWLPESQFVRFVEIVHPAAILRADESQKGLMIKRARVALRDLFEELVT